MGTENGLLHYYANSPNYSSQIILDQSSIFGNYYLLNCLDSNDSTFCHTDLEEPSWFSVSFKNTIAEIGSYSFKTRPNNHCAIKGCNSPRSWAFEALINGKWTVVDQVNTDIGQCNPNTDVHRSLAKPITSSSFRIRKIGLSCENSRSLDFSEFDIFGYMIKEEQHHTKLSNKLTIILFLWQYLIN